MNTAIQLAIFVVEALFAVGVIGSALVILVSTVEDFKVLVERDATPSSPESMQGF